LENVARVNVIAGLGLFEVADACSAAGDGREPNWPPPAELQSGIRGAFN
jgi:hypothetical protein